MFKSLLLWLALASPCVGSFAAENLVPNGDFEHPNAASTWPQHWAQPKSGGSWGQESGNRFLALKSSTPGENVMLYQEFKIPPGTQALEFKWKQRVTGLKKGKQSWFDARILLEFSNAERAKVSPTPPAPNTGKDTDGWVEKSVAFLVPEGAHWLKFMPALFQVEAGSFDIDNIVITPTDAEPLRKIAAEKSAAQLEKQTKDAKASATKASAMLDSTGSLISNGNFETDKKDKKWPDDWGNLKANGSWEVEEGNHFIRMKSTAPDQMILFHRIIPIPAGVKALELGWRWRVTNLKPGKAPRNDARIMMEFLDAAGKKLSPQPSPPYTRGTKDEWQVKTTSFLVPEGAVALKFMPALFQVAQGTMDLDDFVLKPTDTAALEAQAKLREEEMTLRFVPKEEADKTKWPAELRVTGNRLTDGNGKEVWLQGMNAGGMETIPSDTQPIKSTLVGVSEWKANAIRLPVKEEFWFGRNPIQKDGGAEYRDHIDQCVMIAANRGAYLILDLHRFRAPKSEHAEFWKAAAERYKNHPAVLFDLFNEPHGISWKVWRDGGFVGEKAGTDESAFLNEEEKRKNQGFDSIGMQALINAVRSTGAKNVVIASGLAWSFDLSGITDGYALEDPSGNGVMYAWHVYNWHKGWEKAMLAAAAKFPILVGEVGADEKKMDFIPLADQEDPFTWVPDMLGFIQKHRLNWTGWCLHPRATPVMISDWKYTPTPFWGAFAKDALSGKQFELRRTR